MATKRTNVELAISARDEFSAAFKEFNELVKKTNKAVVDSGRAAGASAKDVKALDTQYAILKTTLDALKDSIATDKATKKSIKAFQDQENALKRVESQLIKAQAAYDKARAAAFELSKTNAGVSPTARANLEASLLTVKRLTTTQRQYRAELERTTATLKRAGVDTTALDARLARLGLRLENNESKARQLDSALKKYSGGASVAARNTSLFNDQTRNAFNATQRLRGQVLALVSAYVGLHGIANEVGNVFRVASDERASEIRFNVAAGGDTEKAAAEMAFVREEADRLKLEYISLAKEYSKFTAALPPGALTIEQQRKVLSAYGTAARVAGLSTDELQGIFKALTQIISKGTLSAEEAKQQLGDRLPGAINIMAAGLGFGADRLEEFYKLMEQGGIDGVKAVVGSADELLKKFGVELPAALDSPAAALASFQSELSKLRLEVAKSGFLGDLTKALTSVTAALQDPQTVEALKEFSAFLGEIIKTLPAIIPYLDEMATGLAVIVALGFANYLRRIVVELNALRVIEAIEVLFAHFGVTIRNLPALVRRFKDELVELGVKTAIVGFTVNRVTKLWEAYGEAVQIAEENLKEVRKAQEEARGEVEKFNKGEGGLYGSIQNKTKAELEQIEKDTKTFLAKTNESIDRSRRVNDLPWSFEGIKVSQGELNAMARRAEFAEGKITRVKEALAAGDFIVDIKARDTPLAKTAEEIEGVTAALIALNDQKVSFSTQSLTDDIVESQKDLDAASAEFVQREALRIAALSRLESNRRDTAIRIKAQEIEEKLFLLGKEELADEELAARQRALFSELSDFRIAEMRKSIDASNSELDRALSKETDLANQIKGLIQSIASERARQEGVATDVRRAGLSATQVFYDKERELLGINARLRQAFADGDFKTAQELARKKEALLVDLSTTEVKSEKTGRVLLSLDRNRLTHAAGLRAANEEILRAMNGQKSALESAKAEQTLLVDGLKTAVTGLQEAFTELLNKKIDLNIVTNKDVLEAEIFEVIAEINAAQPVLTIDIDDELAKQSITKLKEPTKSTHTVEIRWTGQRPPGFAEGGPVPGFAGGGSVYGPGTSTSDSILARLSRGEFVNTARSVRFWGESFFADLNALRMPRLPFPRFAHGGPVSRSGSSGGSGGGRVDRVALDLTINGNPLGEVTGSRSTIDGLIAGLSELRR